jgi:protein gp37
MQNTKIEWAHHTFNPWWGCVKVSQGCANCYAERLDKRMNKGEHWGPNSERKAMSAKYWSEPYKWDADARLRMQKQRVFCASMADVFEDHPEVIHHRKRLFDLIESTPHLIWMLLTKRPENISKLITKSWSYKIPSNAWFGTSVENQETTSRITELINQFGSNFGPQNKLFLSMEPLLGPVDLHKVKVFVANQWFYALPAIDWVIVGGESGPKARPMNPEWVRLIRDQCDRESIAFFFKQWGEWGPELKDGGIGLLSKKPDLERWMISVGAAYLYRNGKALNGRELDGREWDGVPY